jgi:lysophospholipase L1-like esterase
MAPINHQLQRRDFLKSSVALMGAVGLESAWAKPATEGKTKESIIARDQVILFQGDSITDAGRSRQTAGEANVQSALGNGYAWLAAASLLVDGPEDGLKIFNRGISGHKVFQLAERWQSDCLDLKPDVLSILIGVNDIWHMLNGKYSGTLQTYETDFAELLQRTKKALPSVKLVICEPFVLRCGAVNEKWFPEFDGYRAAAKRVAEANQAVWVPFQTMFDDAVKFAPPEHWAKDGVHPSPAGAALMAHAWIKAVHGG